MIKLKISDANDNSDFIRILFEIIHEVRQDIYWGVGDLEIIPRFSGDYPGSGHHKHTEIAYNFGEKVEREKIAFVTTSQLIKVINDAQSIRRAVFVCFSNNITYDFSLRPRVETKEINKLQHELALLEIKVLDGDLLFVLSDDNKITVVLKNKLQEFITT